MKEQPLILVVEDELDLLELLRFCLSKEGFQVLAATNLQHAKAMLVDQNPHLLILDWMLPDGQSIQWLKQLRQSAHYVQLPVIMLTAKAQEEDKLQGLGSGADDYITKPFSPKELVARVKTLLRRSAPHVNQQITQVMGVALDPNHLTLSFADQVIALSSSEFKLLRFFITHPYKSYSRGQLLQFVWGDLTSVEERTVDVHILRLRKILQKCHLEDHLKTIRGVGYQWAWEDQATHEAQ